VHLKKNFFNGFEICRIFCHRRNFPGCVGGLPIRQILTFFLLSIFLRRGEPDLFKKREAGLEDIQLIQESESDQMILQNESPSDQLIVEHEMQAGQPGQGGSTYNKANVFAELRIQ
jgi:hypothetical protein